MEHKRCCYVGTITEFQQLKSEEWLTGMIKRFREVYEGFKLDDAQIRAWKNCFPVMQQALKKAKAPDTNYIVFEYKLPYEGNRRPDVLVISASKILVIEIKDWDNFELFQYDQLMEYVRDIKGYHEASRGLEVIPVLVLTKAHGVKAKKGDAFLRSPDKFEIHCAVDAPVNINAWLSSDYNPAPSILEAARAKAKNRPIPELYQAKSAGIPDTIAELDRMIHYAHDNNKFLLTFVTGVPGSGKTLLGFEVVYREKEYRTLLLSGNDALIDVLHYILGEESKAFIRHILEEKNRKECSCF